MAEEQLDLPAPEAEPEESAEASPSQESADGSAPETGSANGQEQKDPVAKAPDVPVGWKWNGDVNALPEEFKERGRGMLRHFTETSEKLADQRKQLEIQAKQLEAIAQYKKQLEPPAKPKADPNELYLKREYQDAYESGDSEKLWEVQNRISDYRAQKQLQAVEPVYRERMEQFERTTAEAKNTLILKEFGDKHPDFWTHKQSDLAQFVVREICDRQGKSLEDAHRKMEEIANFYMNQARRSLNQTVQEQKKAVTATPTTPMETKYIYVDSQKKADKMNIEFSMDGSDKIAIVKK